MASKRSLSDVRFDHACEHSYLRWNLQRTLRCADPDIIEILYSFGTAHNNIDDGTPPMRSVKRLEAGAQHHYFAIVKFKHDTFLFWR